jgi:putative tryptophan/tyrosine transport system substrate-binding protein
LGVTNGTILVRKCDILFIPDVVLGTGEAMRRREFIQLLGSAAAAWPLVARAQQPQQPVIGYLNSGTPTGFARVTAAFRQGLSDAGYIEGRNVAIEYRWAEGEYDQLPALAADLVKRQIAAMVATTTPAALAAKRATSTIPIVFSIGADPIAIGLVDSLSRPSGNITGVNNYLSDIGAKRLELLRDLVPNAAVIGILVNPNFPDARSQSKDMEAAARILGQQVRIINASSEGELDAAFATLERLRAGGLVVTVDPFLNVHRDQIVTFAARDRIPAMYFERAFVMAGGLMSYASDLTDGYRQAGIYCGRILKGEKVADLPVLQPTKFEFVINQNTAAKMGLEIPPKLLALADQVIE